MVDTGGFWQGDLLKSRGLWVWETRKVAGSVTRDLAMSALEGAEAPPTPSTVTVLSCQLQLRLQLFCNRRLFAT